MSSEEPFWYRYSKGITCGTSAGIAVTFVGHPFDTLKVRLQTQSSISPLYQGMTDCVVKTMKWEGITGLYKGVESLHYFQKRATAQPLNLRDYFISGAITGVVASFTDSPIELVKSKLQFQIIAEKNNIALSKSYSSVWDCFRHTLSNYGLRGVYQGLGGTIARDVPGYFFYFGSNEYFKRVVAGPNRNTSDIGILATMTCAGMTGITFWTITYNVDVIKSAMMADDIERKKRKYKNMVDCALKLYRNEGGYKRFWRGFLPCLYRAFVANAFMLYAVDVSRKLFPTYEYLTKT